MLFRSVVVDFQRAQQIQQAPCVVVEPRDGRRVRPIRQGPCVRRVDAKTRDFLAIARGARGFVVGMRRDQGPEKEERLRRMLDGLLADPAQRFFGHEIGRECVFLYSPTRAAVPQFHGVGVESVAQRNAALVSNEKFGIGVVRMQLAEVAVEVIEPLFVRRSFVPFSRKPNRL